MNLKYQLPLVLLSIVLVFVLTLPYLSDTEKNLSFPWPVTPKDPELERILKSATMENKTVILTTLNDAWAEPNSLIDLFLESFRIGEQTKDLLNHLVIVAVDEKAYTRCKQIHTHCYLLTTAGVNFSREERFMTPDYLKLMWRRIEFLESVLELGYSFIFTDADVMWFRSPFSRFVVEADVTMACDKYKGNPTGLKNKVNGGFVYTKSNNRSIEFYKYWFLSKDNYPGKHDQSVFNKIKSKRKVFKIGVKFAFLDTAYFGGFCEPSKDLNKVCTMHANCCVGIEKKLHDLKLILDDWKNYKSLTLNATKHGKIQWRAPSSCLNLGR